jgi:hypothetical protein
MHSPEFTLSLKTSISLEYKMASCAVDSVQFHSLQVVMGALFRQIADQHAGTTAFTDRKQKSYCGEMSGSHGDEYENGCLPGSRAMQSG